MLTDHSLLFENAMRGLASLHRGVIPKEEYMAELYVYLELRSPYIDVELMQKENQSMKDAIQDERLVQEDEPIHGRVVLKTMDSILQGRKLIDMNALVFDELYHCIHERLRYQKKLDLNKNEQIKEIDDNLEMLLRGMITIRDRDKKSDRVNMHRQGVREIKRHLRSQRLPRTFAHGTWIEQFRRRGRER